MNKKNNENKILNYAVRLLARRNYHSIQLREKLTKKGIGTHDEVEAVMEKLQRYKYINDQAYLQYYIYDQLTLRPQSVRLVRQKLFRKGIRGDEVEKELNRYESSEVERAHAAFTKKDKTLQENSPRKRREKLFRFLAGRGFTMDTIKKALEEKDKT